MWQAPSKYSFIISRHYTGITEVSRVNCPIIRRNYNDIYETTSIFNLPLGEPSKVWQWIAMGSTARLFVVFLFLFAVVSTFFRFLPPCPPSLGLARGHTALSADRGRVRGWCVSLCHAFQNRCILHMKAVSIQHAFDTGKLFLLFSFFLSLQCLNQHYSTGRIYSRPQLWINFRQSHPVL